MVDDHEKLTGVCGLVPIFAVLHMRPHFFWLSSEFTSFRFTICPLSLLPFTSLPAAIVVRTWLTFEFNKPAYRLLDHAFHLLYQEKVSTVKMADSESSSCLSPFQACFRAGSNTNQQDSFWISVRTYQSIPNPSTDLRSQDPSAEKVLGDKAVGGIDADKDHVPNVVSGLKAYVNNQLSQTY
jgi:hypothetical protein